MTVRVLLVGEQNLVHQGLKVVHDLGRESKAVPSNRRRA